MSPFDEYLEECAAWLRAGAEGRLRAEHAPEAFIVIAERPWRGVALVVSEAGG